MSAIFTSSRFDIAVTAFTATVYLGQRFMHRETVSSKLLVGCQAFVIANAVDRALRHLLLEKPEKFGMPFVDAITEVVIEEVINVFFLNSQSTHWMITTVRVMSSWVLATFAVRALFDGRAKSDQGSKGWVIIGLIWAVARESAVKLFPVCISYPFYATTDCVIFGLAEVDEEETTPFCRLGKDWFYKVISGIAFRAIAQAAISRGGGISSFVQHVLFNVSRTLS